eukprot:SAG22_NODE_6712_length_821_cov_0.855956_2_plen_82_part_01
MNNQVLETGDGKRPSGLGTLIRNTLLWLSEPSQQLRSKCGLAGGCGPAPGGYVTNRSRLVWPSQQAALLAAYAEVSAPYPAA